MSQHQCATLGTPGPSGTTLATDHPPPPGCRPLYCCLHAHAGKHHRAYVDNMNKQIAGTDLEGKSLEEIVLASWNGGKPTPVFNNAAQVRATREWHRLAGPACGEHDVDATQRFSCSCCCQEQLETFYGGPQPKLLQRQDLGVWRLHRGDLMHWAHSRLSSCTIECSRLGEIHCCGTLIQICRVVLCAGVEPHLLLGEHEAQRWW